MSSAMCEPIPDLMITTVGAAEHPELTVNELVKGDLVLGQEFRLLQRISPLVRVRNVALDLASVDRIDAAGISALVALYREARENGFSFSLMNVPARVAEILCILGLEPVLSAQNGLPSSHSGINLSRAAA